MFGNVVEFARRIAAGNRWLVVAFAVLTGLWALEYLAHGAVGVMRDLATVKRQISATNVENENKARVLKQRTDVSTQILTDEERDARICGDAELRREFRNKVKCPDADKPAAKN